MNEENTQTKKTFDWRTHVKDPKTGRLVKFQPYKMVIKDGLTMIERPIDSGNWFHPNGEPIKKETKQQFVKKEKADESKADTTP